MSPPTKSAMIPHEVVGAMVNGAAPAVAWREYLKLTVAEAAERIGISQPEYAQLEAAPNYRKAEREKLATALGIAPAQLDV